MSSETLARPRPTLIACCGAHLAQDGLSALQFVLLPILAQTFSLSYAQVGMLRAVSHTAMSLLELPAGLLAERVGERRLLVVGLVGAAAGYLCVAFAPSFMLIALGFFLAGAGAAFQHSLASSLLVKRFDGGARREALGTYNSAGDAGKLAFTGLFSAAVGATLSWSSVVSTLALATLAFAGLLFWLLQPELVARSERDTIPPVRIKGWGIADRGRFATLTFIILLDGVVQAVFLTFIAFIMQAKGAGIGAAGLAVVLVLAGGMVGKFACGFLAARLGDRTTFVLVQLATLAGLATLTVLTTMQAFIVLPLIGLVVQGSTTVSYGSVAEFVEPGYQARGYALIYSIAGTSSVIGPYLLGIVADTHGLNVVLIALAALTAITIMASGVLRGHTALEPSTAP